MRLSIKNFTGLLLGFVILVKFMMAGAVSSEPQPLHSFTATHVSKNSHHKPHKDGEQNIIHTSVAGKTAAHYHPAKYRPNSLQGILSAFNVAVKYFIAVPPAVYEKAQHFTPLFRFLLYPKHWFW